MRSAKKTIIALMLLLLTACSGNMSKTTVALDNVPTLQITNTPRVLPTAPVAESTPTLHVTTTPRPSTTAIPTESTPTNTAEPITRTPTSTKTQATATLSSTIGHIRLPGTIGDAGFTFAFATSVIEVTWIDPPSACNQYDFLLSDSSSDWAVIGTDFDPSDGVSIEWVVPEKLSEASLMGEAYCEEPSVIHSFEFDYLFSGDAPLEGVCVLISGTIGSLDLYLEPSLSSKRVGFLSPDKYALVLGRTQDGWYRIDASDCIPWIESQSLPESGWVADLMGIRLFGPCDNVPVADDPWRVVVNR
jgi:hypothetical protein